MKKKVKQVLHSAAYQLKLLAADRKLLMLFICILIFMYTYIKELRTFLSDAGVGASPFFFPFMASSPWLYICMLVGIVPLMSEAPFYRKEQLFLIIREGRSRWVLGNIIYCVCFCLIYTMLMLLASNLVLAGHIAPGLKWGKVWTTMAVTDASSQIGFSVPVSQYIIFTYTPLQAIALAAVLNVLVNIFYSFLLWALNLTAGRLVSIAVVCASMCLVTRVAYLPSFVWYLTPAAWADLGSLTFSGDGPYTVVKSFILLVILDVILGIFAYVRSMHVDLGK